MPRPQRIQYEHAFYHVANRGRDRQNIFPGGDYYAAFLQILEEAQGRFDAQIHAYCLMSNHYQLLVETPRANLDRTMRHINGVYTLHYNRLKQADGPLFRGRYKAVLVDEDAHLLQVGRFIHRHPIEVKGAAVKTLEQFEWSSYPAYINQVDSPAWLQRDLTFKMLGRRHRYKAYEAYVKSGNEAEITQFYSKGNVAAIMGDKAFRVAVMEKRDRQQSTAKLSKAVSDRPDMSKIVKTVAKVFKTTSNSIEVRGKGRQYANLPRQMAIYCCQQFGDHSLKDIADYFQLTNTGSVSPAVSAIKKRLLAGELKKEHTTLEKLLRLNK